MQGNRHLRPERYLEGLERRQMMSEDTIAILFARDPLKYKEGDVEAVIEYQRLAREQYKQSGGKKITATKVVADLGDLGLL